MKKPKFLYHCSTKKIDELVPRKPSSFDLPENSIKAVYATPNKNRALGVGGLSKQKYCASFRGNDKIHFYRGEPKMRYIYLHYLSPKTFREIMPELWASEVPVKPFKIERYNVSDLGHLWVKSNKKELKEFLKDRQKWRLNH